MKREDVIREVMTLMPEGITGYQVAKAVVLLARAPDGAGPKRIGSKFRRQVLTQDQCRTIVTIAENHIRLADAPD